jgi:hypothetical protein
MIRAGRLPDAAFLTSRPVALLILLILVQLVVAQSLNLVPRIITVDFFQYWGVGAARRMATEPLGTPYRDMRAYWTVLNQHTTGSSVAKLDALSRAANRPGFTATPLTYLGFAAFPADFTTAAAVYHVIQLLAFFGGVIVVGRVYRFALFPLVCLACVLVLGSGPVSSDLRVGNIGCLQFAALAGCVAVADRLRQTPRPAVVGGVLLSGVAVLVLVKPNIVPALGMLALHLWVVRGPRVFVLSAVPAVVVGAVAVVAPCLYFGTRSVWYEWYRFVFGHNPYALARAPGGGNYSGSRLFATWLGVDVWVVIAAILALIGLSALAVLAGRDIRTVAAAGLAVRATLARVLGDLHVATAIGVIASIALPPLTWYHYYVIALIPGLWLLTAPPGPGSRPAMLCGLAGLILGLGLLNVLFIPLGWTGAVSFVTALSWIPLWAGVLLRLRAPADAPTPSQAMPAPPVDVPEPRREPESRRARRGRKAAARS